MSSYPERDNQFVPRDRRSLRVSAFAANVFGAVRFFLLDLPCVDVKRHCAAAVSSAQSSLPGALWANRCPSGSSSLSLFRVLVLSNV